MKNLDCESVRVAAMAIADGEESPLQASAIEEHLFNCEGCREEIEQLRSTDQMLSSQKRLQPEANLWPSIGEHIETTTATSQQFGWRVLLLFGIPLFTYKFFLLGFQVPTNIWSKLVLLIVVIAIFGYLKTNPFKINTELRLEGEMHS